MPVLAFYPMIFSNASKKTKVMQGNLADYSPGGRKESGTTEQLSTQCRYKVIYFNIFYNCKIPRNDPMV